MSDANTSAVESLAATPKHGAILEAATRVILEQGYGAASMDAIAQEAGVSKQTVYNHFGSKEALFNAIIRDRCDTFLVSLLPPDIGAKTVEEAMTAIARNYLSRVLMPSSISLYRLLMAEALRVPELGEISYKAGAARAVANLARYLEEQVAKGTLCVADAPLAAEQFFAMLLGFMQVRALLGVGQDPDPALLERHIAQAVHTFLAAYRRPA